MTYRRNDPNPFLLFLVILCVIGVFFLVALAVWVLVDAFLIPGMVDQLRQGTRQRATNELLAMGAD